MNKNMLLTSIIFLIAVNMQLLAQRKKEIKNSEVEGIYVSADDFKNSLMSRPTDNKHKGDKIKLKQLFVSPEIISIEQSSETMFYKDSIFAIRLINGENYRFINRNPCLVADTSFLYIYMHKTIRTGYKHSGPHRKPIDVPISYYYFSVGNHKAVFMLTLANLRKYALDDTIFHTTVCNKFTTDEMLHEINPVTGRYELNETILSAVENSH
jgi:hypothetical protein